MSRSHYPAVAPRIFRSFAGFLRRHWLKIFSPPLLGICIALLFSIDCAAAPRRIDHIVKVTIVDDETAQMLLRDPETGVLHAERYNVHNRVTAREDVPAHQEIWAEYVGSRIGYFKGYRLTIHVHSREEIELSASYE